MTSVKSAEGRETRTHKLNPGKPGSNKKFEITVVKTEWRKVVYSGEKTFTMCGIGVSAVSAVSAVFAVS